ncbi:holo-ACP synthase [Bacillota bacterium LX-D]|nr:holo-ACP synthase [Bacillota bacterium LX-D]
MIKGIGTDIIEINRLHAAFQRRPALEKRLFTAEEILYCREKHNPYPSFAVRFAAKEAVLKALGTGLRKCSWQEINIEVNSMGAPQVKLTGQAAIIASQRGIEQWHLSLAHSADYAIAYVAGE